MVNIVRNKHAPHINFSELKGLFGSKSPSDIDMVLRSGNRFLICEWKRGPHEQVMQGQELLLKYLSKINNFTVLIVYGNTDEEMVVDKFFKVNFEGPCTKIGDSLEKYKEYLVKWNKNV